MSSVTAVPLQPLKKGSIAKLWIGLLVVVLLGVGLAWIGTAGQQVTTTASGVQYRTVDAGEGEPITAADLALVQLEIRGPDGQVLQSADQPQPLSLQTSPPWLADVVSQMRQGGAYQVFVPAALLLEGQPAPPESPIQPGDRVEFRIRVAQIARGMAAMQQMMGGGPGGPGAPGAPGAPAGPGAGGAPGGPGGAAPTGPGAGPAPEAPGAQVPPPAAQPQAAPGNGQ